jgi:hypothetical protein
VRLARHRAAPLAPACGRIDAVYLRYSPDGTASD